MKENLYLKENLKPNFYLGSIHSVPLVKIWICINTRNSQLQERKMNDDHNLQYSENSFLITIMRKYA